MKKCMIGLPGRKDLVNLYNLPSDAIDIDGILSTLANINRFNGRGDKTVSVLTHSVFAAMIAKYRGYSPDIQLAALCHDFGEAYTGDIINPIKQLIPEFKRIEYCVMCRIAFTINVGPFWAAEVKEVDLDALYIEAIQCGFDISEWGLSVPSTYSALTKIKFYFQACHYTPENARHMYNRLCDEVAWAEQQGKQVIK